MTCIPDLAPDRVSSSRTVSGQRRAFNVDSISPALLAILNGNSLFSFVFQPIVDVRQSAVAGYEALVRFPAELGMAPDVAFQAAEACSLRTELETVVLQKALEAQKSLPPDTFLTVNASPEFILSDAWDLLLRHRGTLRDIVIEITEQDSIDDYAAMRRKISRIREYGGHVAVDDTGAGYASLKHMLELRPNFLKLDRYFVGECHSEQVKSALIEMIRKVASRMDAWIVAEGVETSDELDELMRLGVPLVQGYHLGHPEPTMRPLSLDRAAMIRSRLNAMQSDDALRRDVEQCPVCTSRAEATVLLRQTPGIRYAVLLDEWGRPSKLMERHPLLGTRDLQDLMRVQITANAVDVLHRALARPEATRFDCLAAVNERGRFQGILRIDRLVRSQLGETMPSDDIVETALPATHFAAAWKIARTITFNN